MKTNPSVWRWYRVRVWAGLLAILILVLAEFGMVFRFRYNCSEPAGTAPPVGQFQGLGDWLASR